MSLLANFFEFSPLSFFLWVTKAHPLFMGFLKFGVFASLGEFIVFSLSQKKWAWPPAFLAKAFLWGLVGVSVAFSFDFYTSGVRTLLEAGSLPGKDSLLAFAFYTSLFNNLTFAPLMMSFHKFCHAYIERRFLLKGKGFTLESVIDSVDWKAFYKKVCLRKIPFFWLPIHTLTFLLPESFRVLFAALLSLILGVFLTEKKKSSSQKREELKLFETPTQVI